MFAVIAGAGLALCVSLALVSAMNARLKEALRNSPPGISAEGYVKNSHTRQQAALDRGRYLLTFVFRDHKRQDWKWDWAYDQARTKADIDRFGVPPRIPFLTREKILAEGMFRLDGNMLRPDFPVLVRFYMPYMRPLYDLSRYVTASSGNQELVREVLTFLQDLPYGIPPGEINGKIIAGLLPPPQSLLEGWGDCDTKALMMAATLAHDPEIDIIFITVPKHMFIGIAGIPRPYDKFINYQGKRYILAEPAGPGRLPFGQSGTYRGAMEVEASVSSLSPTLGANPVIGGSVRGKQIFSGEGATLLAERESNGLLELGLQVQRGRKFQVALKHEDLNLPNDRIFVQQIDEDRLHVAARLSEPGEYSVNVFMNSADQPDRYQFIMSHQTRVDAQRPLPSRFPAIAEGAFVTARASIQQPLEGSLRQGERVSFKITLPEARTCWVVNGGRRIALEKSGNSFSGNVEVKPGELYIAIEQAGADNIFGIAKYDVQ